MKSSFDKKMKSYVVYKVKCNGSNSIHVRHTSRHDTTRILERQKKDYLVEGCGTAEHNIECDILAACCGLDKLMTIGAIYVKILKPQINHRDEYRWGEFTLNY